jgi:hypothetical protein
MDVNMRNNQCLKLHVIMKLKLKLNYNISLILCVSNVKLISLKSYGIKLFN